MTAKSKGKPATKPAPQGELVRHENANGGKLWQGKAANHVAGPGRPAGAIKRDFRDLTDKYGVKVLEQIMLGEIEVPLKYVPECPECGHEGDELELARALEEAQIRAVLMQGTKPSDKTKAVEVSAKIGGLADAPPGYNVDLMEALGQAVHDVVGRMSTSVGWRYSGR